MSDFISWVLAIFIIFAGCVLGILGLGLIHINTDAEGSHTGFVTAVERSGIFVKNYRVYFKTSKNQSQEDVYCVRQDDYKLADELRESSRSDKEITIHYTGESGLGFHLCSQDKITSFEAK